MMVVAQAEARTVVCNPWVKPLYQDPIPYDYVILRGGRGSSKTNEVSRLQVVKGEQRTHRICVARVHLKSIDESAKPELEDRIREFGVYRQHIWDS